MSKTLQIATTKVAMFAAVNAKVLKTAESHSDQPGCEDVLYTVMANYPEAGSVSVLSNEEWEGEATPQVIMTRAIVAGRGVEVANFMRAVAAAKVKASKKKATPEAAAAASAAAAVVEATASKLGAAAGKAAEDDPETIVSLGAEAPDSEAFEALDPKGKRAVIMEWHDRGASRKAMAARFKCRLTYVQDTVARALAARKKEA